MFDGRIDGRGKRPARQREAVGHGEIRSEGVGKMRLGGEDEGGWVGKMRLGERMYKEDSLYNGAHDT
jgi:hypothetical protein